MLGRGRLGLGEQLAYFRLFFPSFQSRIHNGCLRSIGFIQPTVISRQYEVEFTQRGGKWPEVRVINPRLERGKQDEDIPHMYCQERLCLYLPSGDEWKPSQPIALTIVPWTSLWLAFYEGWLATGEWQGGGVHPETPIRLHREHDEYRRRPK